VQHAWVTKVKEEKRTLVSSFAEINRESQINSSQGQPEKNNRSINKQTQFN